MQFTESQIKAAILHPEEEVRLTALAYFADSYSTDESIMSAVIEAIETHGRESAFRTLRDADRLPQSGFSFNWLLDELRVDFNPTDIEQDNYRFAVCLALLSAPLKLLAERRSEIIECRNFASELRPALDELTSMASWDWETGWNALVEFARELRRREATNLDWHRHARLIRVLGSMQEEGADQILNLLKGRYRGTDRELMQWVDPWIVELAGAMQIKEAVPLIIDRVFDGDESVTDECGTALAGIGGDEVVKALSAEWWEANDEFRSVAAEALNHIHSDLSAEVCLEFLSEEQNSDIAMSLGTAVLSHFTIGHIDAVRELVLGYDDDLEPEQWDLRYKLIATATITEERFPEYEPWRSEAIESNYGSGGFARPRIADNFRPDASSHQEPETSHRKRVLRNEPCPCGSGKKYKLCCSGKNFEWLEDDDGNIFKSVPMSDEVLKLVEDQRQSFIERYGREPEPDDLVFPDMPHPEHAEHQMVELMKEAGIDPAMIHAFEKIGRLVTEENQDHLSDEELAEWDAAIEEYETEFGLDEPPEFPIGTIALYGPDDMTTTKIVAAVVSDPDAEPIIERWVGARVTENEKVQRAIEEFFDKNSVKSIAAAETNLGCPHEEGEDFPVGEDCPFCPFWKGRQRGGALPFG